MPHQRTLLDLSSQRLSRRPLGRGVWQGLATAALLDLVLIAALWVLI